MEGRSEVGCRHDGWVVSFLCTVPVVCNEVDLEIVRWEVSFHDCKCIYPPCLRRDWVLLISVLGAFLFVVC